MKQPPPFSYRSSDFVSKPTFFAKFRRRRKAPTLSSVLITLSLFILISIVSSVHSLPFIPPGGGPGMQSANAAECDMTRCFTGNTRQQPNLAAMACPQLKELHQCLKSLKCNGNLQYHTFQWMVKNSKKRCRDKGGNRRHHPEGPSSTQRQPDSTPPVRSGDSYANFQQLSKSRNVNNTPPQSTTSQQPPQQPPSSSGASKSLSEQFCLSAAYNFTIGEPLQSSSQFAYAFKSSLSVANPEELSHLYKSHLLPDLRPQASYHLEPEVAELEAAMPANSQPSRTRHSQKERVRRDTVIRSRSPVDPEMKKRMSEAAKAFFRGDRAPVKELLTKMDNTRAQQSGRPVQSQKSSSSSSDLVAPSSVSDKATLRNSRDISVTMQADQSVPTLTEMLYKPVAPMTPSLTCMIFGDPHLRTFDSRYQTCNCLGARSLIEHPLFDVQITNTRLQDQFNATGVTKVIVQVRHFSPCSIATDLLYETDSLTQDLPSSTFTDGSTDPNPLIRITTSSEELGLVVTIHLDHIGVRIYVSQFTHTKFINVVIKFRTATSASVKQKLVLDAISPISLCKSGCGPRDVVDLESVLKAAGIDTKQPAKGVIQDVVVPAKKDEDDSVSDEEDTEGDDKLGGSYFDEHGSSEDQYEDDYEDDDYDVEADEDPQGAMMQPQKDPRSKRVKKDADTSTAPPRKHRNKNRERKNKNRQNKEQSGGKRDLRDSSAASSMDSFHQLKPSSGSVDIKSASVLQPPVPLHLLLSPTSSSTVAPELPPLKDQLFSNDLIPLHKPTLTDECNEMMDFYRLACLYDTVLKGIASNYPHKFAFSFDEPRLAEYGNQNSTKPGTSSSPSSARSSTLSGGVLLLIVTLVTFTLRL